MLYPLVFLIGILISLMIAFNGALGSYLNAFEVSFVVHLIGLIGLIIMLAIKRERIVLRGIPAWFLLSGVLGASLTAIDAYGALKLGVTLFVTLSTTSQLICSATFDAIGIGHLAKIKFDKNRMKSIALLLIGVSIMLFAQWKGW